MRHCGILAGAALLCLAASGLATAARPRYEPGTVLVKFAAPADATRLVAALGDTIAGTTATGVTIVRIGARETVPAEVARYRKLPGVRFAEPDFIARIGLAAPNDTSFGSQWSLAKIQATAGWGVYPGAYGAGGGVPIAIADTGIDSTHSDLDDGRVRIDLGGNCLSYSGCVADPARDDNGHGTHVAGIAAAETNNANGVAGLAYTSSLVPVKVLDASGTGSYSAIANGIAWAVDHGARVINLSLAGTSSSQTLCDAVSTAVSRGAVVVAAAGNDGSSAPHYPAACPGAIGVAATTSSDGRASYSDYGAPDVFVAAPGDSILSTYLGNTYRTMSGTSMAAPLVSALAALLLDEGPRSVADVKLVLATTSDKVGGGYGSDPYGTCSSCTFSSSFGYGRINAYNALSHTLPQPDFGLTVSPGGVNAPLGGAGVVEVTVSSFNGFSGNVGLSVSGLPAGAVAQFAPSTVSAPGQSHLALVVSPTTASGNYVVTITGTSGALARTATLALDVTGVSVTVPTSAPGTPGGSVGSADFELQVSPSQRNVARGLATDFILRTTTTGTLTAPIVLSVSGLPNGASAVFAPPALTAPGDGVLAIATLPTTAVGTFALTITATAGTIVHTATVTLVVT